ncbi:hypothetical protein B0T10DRAFT_553347 [Thelonectria olida]|uniref:Uncharacterized protein n=1 Tax=Thelonectria olida TaxID=1576542 RepID=A0A9P8VTC6_9HYPO|nr:hypothetical protein B0T10DRAFT_553347 [Thelonectria olida]
MAVYSKKLPYQLIEADSNEFTVAPGWKPNRVQRVPDQARNGDLNAFSVPPIVLLQSIDPATGDSLLHSAVLLTSVEALHKARALCFTHSSLHRNQTLLTMIYRCTQGHWSALRPEVMGMDGGPPEMMVYPDDMAEREMIRDSIEIKAGLICLEKMHNQHTS